MAKPKFGCGRPECGCSTGICGRLTFGSGEIDEYGYWEFPCEECARANKNMHPNEAVWPIVGEEDENTKFFD